MTATVLRTGRPEFGCVSGTARTVPLTQQHGLVHVSETLLTNSPLHLFLEPQMHDY